jgi:DNA polymerase elongation subunit (family B)
MAWRNVYYDSRSQSIHLWTWDEKGNRIKLESSYEPYLYVESTQGTDAISIYNTPLRKIKFANQFEKNKFTNETPIKRIFHDLSCDQEFLLSTFKNDVDKPNFGQFPLKIYFFDIETYSTEGFPDPKIAPDTINLFTIYNSLDKKYYTWGLQPYNTPDPDVVYYHCKNELNLLERILEFWENDPPDMVVGWNSESFDIPYIINRLINLLGDDQAKRLSPVNNIYLRENAGTNKFGQSIDRWYIRGVSLVDYMEVYKTFARGDRESYSLGYIGQYELGESKVNIGSTNLSTLADTDWNKFVEYNIQDVRLLVKLDESLKYLGLIRNVSYKGFIPFDKSLGKVAMITGAIAHQAAKDGMVIPTFKNENVKSEYEGGFVQEPERGLSNSVVSYDANSLYPNTIISLNVSPETKIGRIISIENGSYNLKLVNNKIVTLDEEKFNRLVSKESLSVSKFNILYTQKFKGVVPKFIDYLYKERVNAKDEMILSKKELSKTKDKSEKNKLKQKILDLDTLQNTYKLILNSVYGVFGQIYSPFYDIDHAASITLTGQSVVKQAADIVYDYIKDQGVVCEKKDIYKYGDTDSAYFSIQPILDHFSIKLQEGGNISGDARKIIKNVGNHLNKQIIEWSKTELKSTDPRFIFKQEAVCDVAVFMEKKRYVLHVLELEGVVPKNPFKYTGVEVVKSTYSEEVKKLIKQVFESAILSQSKDVANKILKEAYETFCGFPIQDIAFRTKVTDLEKQNRKIGDDGKLGSHTPVHAAASIHYNYMLKHFGITKKYEHISSGTKVKWFYPSKNQFNYKSMAFLEDFPDEFKDIFPINYSQMFEKTVLSPIEKLYDCIGWHVPQITNETHTDLIELFS